MSRLRIGVDVGGTFTDLVLLDEASGAFGFHKVPSTPSDPSEAIEAGVLGLLARAGRRAEEVGFLGHGTTVATNMAIERRGALTGLITTRGFRDVLEIARQTRPHLYDYTQARPAPLAARRHRLEVAERRLADGGVLVPLDEAEVEAAARRLLEAGVEAVAICFLHAWRDAAHEQAAARAVRRVMPEAYISLSAEVVPEFREFDRFSTTVLNAHVGPRMAGYMDRLLARLAAAGIPVEPYTLHSNGGLMSAAAVRAAPVRTCLSGPAAGVAGTAIAAAAAGFPDVVTFDVGGTSTDVSVILHGQAASTGARQVAGHPVKVTCLDIHVIGAGGGSIAWLDAGGALKVGPRSVGADPGPAAYSLGGTEATLTDANIVLGRLDPAELLGGRMRLDAAAARRAVAERVAVPLGLDAEAAALGIVRIAVANMGRAIRSVTTERGFAPERFALFAFGGAGPLHAVEVAEECGIPIVVIPREPGTMCARGMLLADVTRDFVHVTLRPLDAPAWAEAAATLAALRREAESWLVTERMPPARRLLRFGADLRYEGQNHEVGVALDGPDMAFEAVLARFADAHERSYGYAVHGRGVELVNLRLQAVGRIPPVPDAPQRPRGAALPAPRGIRQVRFRAGTRATPIYDRDTLPPGLPLPGPAIIAEMSATTVLPPGPVAEVDAHGNLILRLPPRRTSRPAFAEALHA
jgi:N-methylhydantoinase A